MRLLGPRDSVGNCAAVETWRISELSWSPSVLYVANHPYCSHRVYRMYLKCIAFINPLQLCRSQHEIPDSSETYLGFNHPAFRTPAPRCLFRQLGGFPAISRGTFTLPRQRDNTLDHHGTYQRPLLRGKGAISATCQISCSNTCIKLPGETIRGHAGHRRLPPLPEADEHFRKHEEILYWNIPIGKFGRVQRWFVSLERRGGMHVVRPGFES